MQARFVVALVLASLLCATPRAFAQTGSISSVETIHFGGGTGSTNSFGNGVWLDGNQAIVMRDSELLQAYEYLGGNWTYRGQLPVAGPKWTVSFDGDLVLVGKIMTGPTQAGRVGVMRRGTPGGWNNNWLDAPDPNLVPEQFGIATAVDDTTVVIANPNHTQTFGEEGAVYVYEDTGAALVLRQSIYGGATGLHLGADIALDGDDLLVSYGAGVVYRLRSFRRSGATWSMLQPEVMQLNAPDILLDHGTAIVRTLGSQYEMLAYAQNGWFIEGSVPQPPPGSGIIGDIAISDGVMAFGMPSVTPTAQGPGAVHLYARNNGWKLQHILAASDGANGDYFGGAVALDGTRLIVGASGHDHYGNDKGAAYVFELTYSPAQVYCVPELTSAGCVARMGFDGAPSASSSMPFTVYATRLLEDRIGALVYGTSGRLFLPYPGGIRCLAPPRFMTARQTSGTGFGTCGGTLTVDFNALIQSGLDPQLVAGVQVNAQWIFRDPEGVSALASSAAIEFDIQP